MGRVSGGVLVGVEDSSRVYGARQVVASLRGLPPFLPFSRAACAFASERTAPARDFRRKVSYALMTLERSF